MPDEPVVRLLAATALLTNLDDAQRKRLAAAGVVRRYQRGEQVFARGEVGGGMFVVAKGSVALVVNSAAGNEVVLDVLRPPRSFGEMAVVDGGARIATAFVREPTVLLELPRAEMLRLITVNAPTALALLGSLANLVRRIDEHASDLVLLDLRGRVAKFLLGTTVGRGAELPGSATVPVDIRLNQTEIAQLVGGSRQQLNRILGELARAGAIERRGATIVSVRRDLLRSWSDAG